MPSRMMASARKGLQVGAEGVGEATQPGRAAGEADPRAWPSSEASETARPTPPNVLSCIMRSNTERDRVVVERVQRGKLLAREVEQARALGFEAPSPSSLLLVSFLLPPLIESSSSAMLLALPGMAACRVH